MMYILKTPKGYPLICQMRSRKPGEEDKISTTSRHPDGRFVFRPLFDHEKKINVQAPTLPSYAKDEE